MTWWLMAFAYLLGVATPFAVLTVKFIIDNRWIGEGDAIETGQFPKDDIEKHPHGDTRRATA